MKQQEAYQLRHEGLYEVYLIRAGGRDIPQDKQVSVYRSKSLSSAQAVADALNSGLRRVCGFAITKGLSGAGS